MGLVFQYWSASTATFMFTRWITMAKCKRRPTMYDYDMLLTLAFSCISFELRQSLTCQCTQVVLWSLPSLPFITLQDFDVSWQGWQGCPTTVCKVCFCGLVQLQSDWVMMVCDLIWSKMFDCNNDSFCQNRTLLSDRFFCITWVLHSWVYLCMLIVMLIWLSLIPGQISHACTLWEQI